MKRTISTLIGAMLAARAAFSQSASTPTPSPLPTITPTPITRTSYFNEAWLNAVVSIERETAPGKFAPLATGFLLQSEHQHYVLVTAKHVLHDSITNKLDLAGLSYVVNVIGKGPQYFSDLRLERDERLGTWFESADSDVALRYFGVPTNADVAWMNLDLLTAPVAFQPGAPLLVLGFPMGLRSPAHPLALARHGTVALAEGDSIVIDSLVFPGNSGGPVVYVPPVRFGGIITGGVVNTEQLVGLVSGYIPYRDVAVSKQTNQERVLFEENSGLALVVPRKAILALIRRPDVAQLDTKIR